MSVEVHSAGHSPEHSMGPAAGHAEEHVHHPNYVKIWGVLVALLIVSVLGPLTGIRWLMLFAAFGIAIVKAYIVAKNFMHVNLEKRWVTYLLVTSLVFLLILFSGVAPDIMKHQGLRWENYAAKKAVESGSQSSAKHE